MGVPMLSLAKLLMRTTWSLISLTVWTGCATEPATHFTYDSPLLSQGRTAFALYNDDSRLISNPLFEIRRAIPAPPAGTDAPLPVTDLYVVIHGWNFTLAEAIANSHRYIESLDQQLSHLPAKSEFRPFLLFVAWPSVSRPLGDLATAVLPFGLDRGLRDITNIIDGTVLFLPTAWKQSLNSFTVALGHKPPDRYFTTDQTVSNQNDRHPSCEPLSPLEHDVYGVQTDTDRTGRDCPVSALLYSLIRWNEAVHGGKIRLHIVGHSYGAKLATLAAVESLRRWEEAPVSPRALQTLPNTNHSALCEQEPIASLVLFNAAFHPREIIYHAHPYGANPFEGRVFPVPYLQCIPRKALVYGRRDHATGSIFNLSQLLMDNRLNTYLHQPATWVGESRFGDGMFGPVYDILNGSVSLGLAMAEAPINWSFHALTQLPQDFMWHLRTNDSIIRVEATDNIWWTIGRVAVNTLDFFVPASHFINPLPHQADRMGILRSTLPAIGNTGLDRLRAGRDLGLSSMGATWTALTDEQSHTTDQNADQFCRLAVQATIAKPGNSIFPSGPLNKSWLYSFDGSPVMDTVIAPSGAHGDLREKDEIVLPASCGTTGLPLRLQKREAVLNFVLTFTQGR